MLQKVLFLPHSLSSLPDDIKGLACPPFLLSYYFSVSIALSRKVGIPVLKMCLVVVFTIHPLLSHLNSSVIYFTIQKVLGNYLEEPYLFADILVLCATWIQQLVNLRLCSREVNRSQWDGKMKQLKWSDSYNPVAGITRVGDSLEFFYILALMTMFSYFYVVTLGYIYSYTFTVILMFVWLLNSLWCSLLKMGPCCCWHNLKIQTETNCTAPASPSSPLKKTPTNPHLHIFPC